MRRLQLGALFVLFLALLSVMGCSKGSNVDAGPVTDGDEPILDGDADPEPEAELPPVDGDDAEKDDGGGVIITPGDMDDEEGEARGCATDRNCPGDQYCDDGSCRFRGRLCDPCQRDVECGYAEDICLPDTSVCGQFCDALTPCPNNYECREFPERSTSQCVFLSGSGEIGAACCDNSHCTTPNVCYAVTKLCYAGCTAGNCPPGYICVDDPGDDRNGYCTEGCETKADCLGGQVCANNKCVEGDCGNKLDCPLEYLCDTSTLRCKPGCEGDDDCLGANECLNSLCVERVGCEGTFQCHLGQNCTVEIPDAPPEQRGCCFNPRHETTGDCTDPQARTCCHNPEPPQKYCDPCTDTQNQNNECGDGNYCVSFKDQDGKPIGDFCIITRDCTAQTDSGMDEGTVKCPRGYTCTQLDVNGEKKKACVADCTREVFQE